MPKALRPAVFLDRDGTLIVDRHYLAHPDGVALLPGTERVTVITVAMASAPSFTPGRCSPAPARPWRD